jgi:UDP-N-acetyl-D-galactosamine dehydrogenase
LAGKDVRNAKVYLLGLTFKENCPDIRNTRVVGIIQYLREYGINVQIVDPWADKAEAAKEYGVDIIDMADVKDADALVLCVAHKEFVALSAEEINSLYSSEGKNVFFDVKSAFSKEQFKDYNFSYWSL